MSYINSIHYISYQNTFENFNFENLKPIENSPLLIEPNYKTLIPPTQIRRMSKIIKMGVCTAKKTLENAIKPVPDAIIFGTSQGCSQDSENFLNNILNNQEQFLTPTHFIQSTHNTIAGQIALLLNCKNENITYANPCSSFENSLLDSQMMLQEKESILVGAGDEKSKRTEELYLLQNIIQSTPNSNLLTKKTKGYFWGEGVGFLILENQKNSNTYCELVHIETINCIKNQNFTKYIDDFLNKYHLTLNDIDTFMLGINGTETDHYYDFFIKNFQDSNLLYWKHLSGEYGTSSMMAVFLSCQILKNQQIPHIISLNSQTKKNINHLLIYNQINEKEHCFILLKKV